MTGILVVGGEPGWRRVRACPASTGAVQAGGAGPRGYERAAEEHAFMIPLGEGGGQVGCESCFGGG